MSRSYDRFGGQFGQETLEMLVAPLWPESGVPRGAKPDIVAAAEAARDRARRALDDSAQVARAWCAAAEAWAALAHAQHGAPDLDHVAIAGAAHRAHQAAQRAQDNPAGAARAYGAAIVARDRALDLAAGALMGRK